MSDIEISVKANFSTKISVKKLINMVVLIFGVSVSLIYNVDLKDEVKALTHVVQTHTR